MTCDELRDDYDAYALGVLDGEALSELRAHLARQCENCTPGVRKAEELVARMALTVTPVDPPRRLRKRVTGLVSPATGSRSTWALAAVTAVSLAFAVHVYTYHQGLVRAVNGASAQIQRLNETLAVLKDPAATEVTFGKGAHGRVVISPRHGVAFSGQNMAALPAGKTYEMWIIPKGGKPVPAGTFEPSPDGSALHLQNGPVDIASTAAIAVTIEAQGGVPAPTSTPIIVAPL